MNDVESSYTAAEVLAALFVIAIFVSCYLADNSSPYTIPKLKPGKRKRKLSRWAFLNPPLSHLSHEEQMKFIEAVGKGKDPKA